VVHPDDGTTYNRAEPKPVAPQSIDPNFTLDGYLREKYGQEIFDKLTEEHKGQRVNYVYVNKEKEINIDIDGTVVELFAPANAELKRGKDSYRVLWDNNKTGVIELSENSVTLLD